MVVELLETYCRSHTYISLKNGAPSRLVKKVPNRSSIVIILLLVNCATCSSLENYSS